MTASQKMQSARLEKSHMLDELIMGTNSSSIVSKRSVERLYYPDEPHYFRYFVKKFQRRAPLINRGYWLRLRAIDVMVHQFLSKKQGHKKIVINLGCGSDVLPWQSQVRYASLCQDVLFVDVDYPDLMRKKRAIVLETPQLREILGQGFTVSDSEEDQVLLRSERYCQIGCDLRELERLRQTLNSLTAVNDCPVLFVAEVSVTYMDTNSADALIQWASGVGKSEFCLLEQLLPQGPDHPFAVTMLNHFDKLKTPPKSVGKYPTLSKQHDRFTERGWPRVDIWDLWEAWSSETFVSSSERAALDEVEPFDEWEEFVLFGRHYFVIHASSFDDDAHNPPRHFQDIIASPKKSEVQIFVSKHDVSESKRRFGDALTLKSSRGTTLALHLMGLGTSGRSETCDIYSLDRQIETPRLPILGPIPRMCHTLTDLGEYGVLLAGGRGSPANPLSDCWIFEKGAVCQWKPTSNLPTPLFRHSTICLPGTSLALVAGGKTGPSNISDRFYIFDAMNGWTRCEISGDKPPAIFGAVLSNLTCSGKGSRADGVFTGILAGGIGVDGLINEKKYIWHLNTNCPKPSIHTAECGEDFDPLGYLSIFGAKSVDFQTRSLVCGGVGSNPESQGHIIMAVAMKPGEKPTASSLSPLSGRQMLPFMIGSSIGRVDDNIVVMGGGATCFSMGTFWETGIFSITFPQKTNHGERSPPIEKAPMAITLLGSQKIVGSTQQCAKEYGADMKTATIEAVSRLRLETAEQFSEILQARLPVIIEKADLGECIHRWRTPSYLVDRIGSDTKVVIHDCQQNGGKMDFNSKNFAYVTEPFGKVVARAAAGEQLYLRALSQEKPSERPANIGYDFPGLAADFSLPSEMNFVRENLFSSVFRVSGRVHMWLHYDVMANVYAQISGSKRMVLFPPSDVNKLAFAPGASSSSIDVFAEQDSPELATTHPYEALLEPGDVLYLPPLWLHAAAPVTDFSVAVNVFFRDLEGGYATGKDVYGNKDLAAYEKGRLDVGRLGKSFQQFPLETRRFYLRRLARELELAAEGAYQS